MLATRSFKFDAAHYLPNYVGKCRRLHGHTWKLDVCVQGKVSGDTGFVIDFSVLKKKVTLHVLDVLDHNCLNEVLENPTCENLLYWIATRLHKALDSEEVWLYSLTLWESEDSRAMLTYGDLAYILHPREETNPDEFKEFMDRKHCE